MKKAYTIYVEDDVDMTAIQATVCMKRKGEGGSSISLFTDDKTANGVLVYADKKAEFIYDKSDEEQEEKNELNFFTPKNLTHF